MGSRRQFLKNMGSVALSLAVPALIGGCDDRTSEMMEEVSKPVAKKYVLEGVVDKSVVVKPKVAENKSVGEFSYLAHYDGMINDVVARLNKRHDRDLDSDLIRAIADVESGSEAHRDSAHKYDPMQVANPESNALGILAKGSEHSHLIGKFGYLAGKKVTVRHKDGELNYSKSNMTAKDSIEAGVAWLFHKAAKYNERIVESGPVKEYTVKPGDSFWKIAENEGSTEETMRKYNGSADIHPGQKLKVRKAKKKMYISGWRSWKDAVHRYGDTTKEYSGKVYRTLREVKEARE